MKRKVMAGGGWQAIYYTFKYSMEVGPWRMWKKMRSRNACKTCAVGMGGQLGGMVNEAGHFPEVCKKSLQAQAADMKGAIDGDFFERKDLDALLKLTPKQAEDAGRLIYPVFHSQDRSHFQPIHWDTAMETAAQALLKTDPSRTAFYSSGRSSNEAGFLLQSFARVYGTNHVMNCSFFCHQASSVALKMAFGTGTATVTLDDVEHADCVLVLGSNPASNHPRMMTLLANLRARGGDVIVVNPLEETGLVKFHVPSQPMSMLFGSKIASHYIQPLAGGDVHFLVGVLKCLIETNTIDKTFLNEHAEGSQAVLEDARNASFDELVAGSGVDRSSMEIVAARLAASQATIFSWAMGLTHHAHGVDNVLAVCNLAIASGHVGRPGAGMLPLRGHSNVQGVGSVGVAPTLQAGVKAALEKAYNKTLPTEPGYDTLGMLEAADRGDIDVLICLGGNLWGSSPDSDWAARAMQKIGTIVYLNTKLNPGHFYGRGKNTVILPVLARDEEPQATTQESMFNYVRLSEGGPANVKGQMRAESEVICDLANRVLSNKPVDWLRLKDHKEIRKVIAEVIPGWQEIANIDGAKKEFTVSGRIVHKSQFNTDNGRAKMHQTPLPKQPLDALRLITLRSEGQFNTVVYEEQDIYRGMPHRFCILLSAEDGAKLNLKDGQRVTVRGESGSMENIEVVFGKVRPGVAAMFYPEANVLIKGTIDSRSRTPNFKSAPVWINQPV